MLTSEFEGRTALALEGVEAGYGGARVLSDFSLSISAGSITALLGPNGAGKSTVARVACGLLPARRGQVSRSRTPGGAGIGFAPQDIALFPDLSARENVNVAARLFGLPKAQRREAVDRALELTGCGPRADQRVRTLSGGWRRRANLATAMVGRPPLLIADEPTEGVDAATRTVLAAALRSIAAEGAGCLLISHDPAFVAETADRIAVLSQGKLIASGSPQALLASHFGALRLLTLRFARAPSRDVADRLEASGLAGSADGLEWRRLCENALACAETLAPLADAQGGEIAVRRPGLDELVSRLTETVT